MESIEKLREYGHDCCARVDDAIHDYCDEIEREIAEHYAPIVRCRDCKEFSFGDTAHKTVDWCDYWCDCVDSPDGFCAWGERRERG